MKARFNCEDVARAALGKAVKREGSELVYRCPRREQHSNGDAHPSLKINIKKNVWSCFPCGAKGTAWSLAAFLAGLDPSDKVGVTAWLQQRGLLNGTGRSGKQGAYRKPAATYTYTDAVGNPIARKLRFEPGRDGRKKDFSWQRWENDAWVNGLADVKTPLYRWHEIQNEEAVAYFEGEKAANAGAKLGLKATTAGGVNNFRSDHADVLRGKDVVIFPDNDRPGREHALRVATALHGMAKSIRVVALSGLPEKGDLYDFIQSGGTLDAIVEHVRNTPEWQPAAKPPTSMPTSSAEIDDGSQEGGNEADTSSGSAATKLIEIATNDTELFHSGESCFATISLNGHLETYSLRSHGFRTWLSKRFFEEYHRAASGEATTSAVLTLEGIAQFQCAERGVGVRVQEFGNNVYLDLANIGWQVIEVSAAGWRIIESRDCPVRFRRSRGMLALPLPQPGGKIGELRRFLNVRGDDDFLLMTAWLVGALHPTGPYPLLVLHGEQGSAKTTTARCLRALIDPNQAPLRSEPREPRDLMIAANNGWICGFDNLSGIPQWLSDALCRLSTGGGFSTRELYTDDEEIIFEAKRPAILTGIEELATRGDLLDRTLIVDLPRIPGEAYQSEREFLGKYETMRPRLLGALLGAVAAAIANRSKLNLTRLPRMADFAIWVSAAEPAFGCEGGAFIKAYMKNRAAANELPLETPVAEALRKLALPWTGTATELLGLLEGLTDDRARRQKSWPSSARSLSNALRRLAPNLRQAGVAVEFGARQPGTGRRLITLSGKEGSSSSQSSRAVSQPPEAQPQQGVANDVHRDGCDARDGEIPAYSVAGAEPSEPSSTSQPCPEDEL